MTRRLLLLFAVVLLAAPVAAQTPAGAPAQPATPLATTPAPAIPAIEPQGFNYNAEGRRDPFVSLTRRGVVETPAVPSARTGGLAGLTVADISLRGVMVSRGEFVGIVQGVDSKTYIVRAGQKLLDGTIRSIEKDAMVIVQQLNDPLAAEKQRVLRKALRQDEAR